MNVGEDWIRVGPHLIGRFLLDRREVVDYLFGKRKPRTKEMKLGEDWHKKLGFDNEESFEKEVVIDGCRVIVRGIPDYIDDNSVAELKTVGGKYVTEDYLRSAELQLKAYLWLTDRPNGKVIVVNRNTGEVVEEFRVFRDDESVMRVLGEIVREVRRRKRSAKHLTKYLRGLR